MKLIFFIVLSFSLSLFAEVDPAKFKYLAERDNRPSMQDVVETLGLLPGHVHVDITNENNQNALQSLKEKILKDLPNLVVKLESTYPSGRYAFLGRDASGAADLLEAFYLSIGQTGRVLRLRSSGASLSGPDYTQNPQKVLEDFLISNGAPLNTANLAKERPFVIVDATSMGPGSQSTLLAEAGINKLKSLGYTEAEIYPKFAVADISNRKRESAAQNRTELMEMQLRALEQGLYSNEILAKLAPEFAYVKTQPLWHDTFEPLTYIPGTQKVVAKPGPVSNIKSRILSLNNMLMIYQLMGDAEIKAAVLKAAQEQGVIFPNKKIRLRDKTTQAQRDARRDSQLKNASEKYTPAVIDIYKHYAQQLNPQNIQFISEQISKITLQEESRAMLSLLMTALRQNLIAGPELNNLIYKLFKKIAPDDVTLQYIQKKTWPDEIKNNSYKISQLLKDPISTLQQYYTNQEWQTLEMLIQSKILSDIQSTSGDRVVTESILKNRGFGAARNIQFLYVKSLSDEEAARVSHALFLINRFEELDYLLEAFLESESPHVLSSLAYGLIHYNKTDKHDSILTEIYEKVDDRTLRKMVNLYHSNQRLRPSVLTLVKRLDQEGLIELISALGLIFGMKPFDINVANQVILEIIEKGDLKTRSSLIGDIFSQRYALKLNKAMEQMLRIEDPRTQKSLRYYSYYSRNHELTQEQQRLATALQITDAKERIAYLDKQLPEPATVSCKNLL